MLEANFMPARTLSKSVESEMQGMRNHRMTSKAGGRAFR